ARSPGRPVPGGSRTLRRSLAGALVARLVPRRPPAGTARAVNAALVLLADHELATAAVAARIAASTRADLHDVLLAGLGALAGPLHGSASTLTVELLEHAHVEGPTAAVEHALRWRGHVPGFGHAVYARGDPRA